MGVWWGEVEQGQGLDFNKENVFIGGLDRLPPVERELVVGKGIVWITIGQTSTSFYFE